jgi:hypothetical protein
LREGDEKGTKVMKRHLAQRGMIVCALAGVLGLAGGTRGATGSQSSPSTPAAAVSSSQAHAVALVAQAGPDSVSSQGQASIAKPGRTETPLAVVQTGVRELLKMAQAGVSQAVLKAYVENSTMLRPPTSADLIALKDHGINDQTATAFIKRAAELEKSREATLAASSVVQANGGAAAAQLGGTRFPGGLDPESYDFWWYNYAYPRTVASANATVLSSIAPYTPFGFGGYPLTPYGAYTFDRFGFEPFGFVSRPAPFGSFSFRGFPEQHFARHHVGNHGGGGFQRHFRSGTFGF